METPRTILSVPAWRERFAKKAHYHGAGRVIWDLEDGTPGDEKSWARKVVGKYFRSGDWIRINKSPVDYMSDCKLVENLLGEGNKIGAIVLPKFGRFSRMPDYGIHLVGIIETVAVLNHADPQALLIPRVDGLIYGDADMRSEFGIVERGSDVSRQMRIEARKFAANRGIPIWDSPEERIGADGSSAARAAARDGFAGIMVIHPSAIGPSEIEFALRDRQAEEILKAYKHAGEEPTVLEGHVIASPHVAAAKIALGYC